MAHGQWTEIEARGILEALKRSGLGVEKFARSRGLVPQRLYWWKKKLGIGGAPNPSSVPALVPVRVTEGRTEARRGEPVTVPLRSNAGLVRTQRGEGPSLPRPLEQRMPSR